MTQAFVFTAIPTLAGLTIKAEPGAEISSNGKAYGTVRSDGTLEIPNLPLGPFPFLLRRKGFADYRGTVMIAAGQNVKQLSMQKDRGHVAFAAVPATAQIVITKAGASGQSFTSPANADLPEGTYTVEVLADGYQPETETLHIVAGETLTRDFRLTQLKTPAAVKIKPPPTSGFPGWDLVDGYMTKTGGNFSQVGSGIPSAVFFTETHERKNLLFRRGAAVNWAFVSPDGASSLTFHLSEKSLAWEGTGKARDAHGKAPLNSDKGVRNVSIRVGASQIAVSVDGGTPATVEADLAAYGTSRFGFKINGGETLSIKNFTYTPR